MVLMNPIPTELPRRVLFAVNTGWFFLSHRLPIAKALQAEGVEVHLATSDGPDLAEVRAQGIEVHAIPLSRSGLNPAQELRSIAALVRLYRRLRPDLVHHVTPKAVLYGSIAARAAGVPSVVNAVSGLGHAFVGTGTRARLVRSGASILYKLAFRHPNAHTVFQNPSDRAILQRLVPAIAQGSSLIPGSGVPLDIFAPSRPPEGPLTVVLAARMLRNKGVGEFVAAARELRNCMTPPPHMVLVGVPDAGNPTTITADQLTSWASSGMVEWWGHRSDMAQVLRGAHIFCLPSHGGEGVPKAVLEAMASGRPVISTDVPGCRDAVVDGETGILVPPRDVPALASAIAALARDPALRAAMGEAARRRAEALFSIESVVQQHLSIYGRLNARRVDTSAEAPPR